MEKKQILKTCHFRVIVQLPILIPSLYLHGGNIIEECAAGKPILYSVMSGGQLEINHGKSIYPMKISKHTQKMRAFLFSGELLNVYHHTIGKGSD